MKVRCRKERGKKEGRKEERKVGKIKDKGKTPVR